MHRIVDGADPVRSLLVCLLDKEHSGGGLNEPWEPYYARRIVEHFTS